MKCLQPITYLLLLKHIFINFLQFLISMTYTRIAVYTV